MKNTAHKAWLAAEKSHELAVESKLLAEIASGNSSGSCHAAVDDSPQIGVLFDAFLELFQFLFDADKVCFTTSVVVNGLEASIEVVDNGNEIVKSTQQLCLVLREHGDASTQYFYGFTECVAGFRLFTARLRECANASIEPFDMSLEVSNLGFRALARIVRADLHSFSSSVDGCANSLEAEANSSTDAESTGEEPLPNEPRGA